MFGLQLLKMNATNFVLANANDSGAKIVAGIQWIIAGGGLLLAVWGIVQLTQSGRANDSQGKMEASWAIIGGLALLALGAGTLISGAFSNPPGF